MSVLNSSTRLLHFESSRQETDLKADTLHVTKPVALGRPRGAHRFEAFSPKLARRVIYYRRAVLEQWLLLEANPKVIIFCDRPGYMLTNEDRHLAEFWVRYVDHDELVILSELRNGSNVTASHAEPRNEFDACTADVRFVASAELAAARAWTDNWQRILPYLEPRRRASNVTAGHHAIRGRATTTARYRA